ncbi:MAG: RnfABCDGE type electron transport complex subunit B [Cyclobacteriaceae bacterium]
MSDLVLNTVIILGSLGVLAAVILYFVSKKFYVKEDPRIDGLMDVLPNTNCGGCGYPGCRNFAEGLTKASELNDYFCPVGGNEVMKQVADILGMEAVERDPYVAVVRCAGSREHRKKVNNYDGAASCTIATDLYSGDRGCADGCVGLGECADACDFEALFMNPVTMLPEVVEDKCTACNACVTACPKDIIELWPQGKKNKRIYVACVNEEKGGVARKECAVACSGCAKCFDECRYDAITITNNLARIDPDLCKLCAECVEVCDSRNIMSDNVPEATLEKVAQRRERKKEKARLAKEKEKEERLAAKAAEKATTTKPEDDAK